jgi:hypothetical protein
MRSGLRSQQGGMGMLSILVIVGLIVFFVTLLFRLGPAYMNFWTVKSIMDGVGSHLESVDGGVREISNRIGTQLSINNVDQVTVKDFRIKRTGDGLYEVKLDYEQRENLFHNVDVVLTFAHQVEVKGR